MRVLRLVDDTHAAFAELLDDLIVRDCRTNHHDRGIGAANPATIPVPGAETAAGACLFVDVTGFTPMTERLAARGAAGAEEMASILSDYFGPVIDLSVAHGGEIVDFAGDALLIVW